MDDNNHPDLPESISDNELISLGELTEYETAEWRFPDILHCPLKSCGMKFGSRKKAMEHYRGNHAKHAVLCEICKYPLMLLTASHHLAGHFARKHPNVEPPVKVKTDRKICPICEKSFVSYVCLNNHMNKYHTGRHKPKKSKKNITKKQKIKTKKPRKVRPIKKKREEELTETERSNTKSPSWTDIETECSTAENASNISEKGDTSNDASTPDQQTVPPLSQLIKRKAHSFNIRKRARPCTLCGTNLKNYVLACNHYRQVHGRSVAMCPFCKTYFSKPEALIKHMLAYHAPPDKPMSKKSIKANRQAKMSVKKLKANKKRKEDQSKELEQLVFDAIFDTPNIGIEVTENISNVTTTNEPETIESTMVSNDLAEDDLITIGELTEYPTVQWKFPETTHCPRSHCKQKYKSRAENIAHYRDVHAKYDVICNECNILVSVSSSHNLLNHYKRKHSDIELPLKTKENRVNCQFCDKSLTLAQLRIHLNSKHSGSVRKFTSSTTSEHPLKRSKSEFNLAAGISRRTAYRCQSEFHTVNVNSRQSLFSSNFSTKSLTTLNDSSPIDGQSKGIQKIVDLIDFSIESNLKSTSNEGNCTDSPEIESSSRKRTPRVRNKACTICGLYLPTYVEACDHYRRNHGRNVLMCPYCGQYFLQSQVLTKHVLAKHSNNSTMVEPKNEPNQTLQPTIISLDSSDSDNANNTSDPAPTDLTDAAQSFADVNIQNEDEPLNLTVQKTHSDTDAIDEACEIDDAGVIDLSSGALDLTIRK